MAKGDRESKLEGELAERDKEIDSPDVRAHRVWAILQVHGGDLSTWDLVCFCVEFLGSITPRFPWIEKAAVGLARLVYLAHYATENDDGFTTERIRDKAPSLADDFRSDAGTEPKSVVPGFIATGDELRRSSSDSES